MQSLFYEDRLIDFFIERIFGGKIYILRRKSIVTKRQLLAANYDISVDHYRTLFAKQCAAHNA